MSAPDEYSDKVRVYNVERDDYEEVDRIFKNDDEWEEELTQDQYNVTREHGTEHPFSYEGLDNDSYGVYTCVCCGQDLYFSENKFDSGTGWPSFFKPVDEANVESEEDNSLFMKRTEVHCSRCKAHLGHIFDDGPPPTGQRHCINGVALKFKEMEGD